MRVSTTKRLKLAVAPVVSYREPSYPRAGQETDLRFDDPARWPFSETVAALVLAVAGTAGDANAAPPEPELSCSIVAPTQPHRAGPFAPSKATWSPRFGKGGSPVTLPEETVVTAVVAGVFEARGMPLERDVLYRGDGVTVRLDGWSPDEGVGFILLDAPDVQRLEYSGTHYAAAPDDPETLSVCELRRLEANSNIAVIGRYDPDLFGAVPGVEQAARRIVLDKVVVQVHRYIDFLEHQHAKARARF